MLVQLSPWETCSTSVPVSKRRRRTRSTTTQRVNGLESTSEHACAEHSHPLEFEASFVSSKRNRHKKRSVKNPEEATIAITSPHRVCIVGRCTSATSSRHLRDGSEVAESALEESAQWQFRSRPGRTTSFLVPEETTGTTNGSTCTSSRAKVAAVFDARNDKVYALQNENKTLSCWNADTCSGPDDIEHLAVKAQLSSPAVSLSTLAFLRGVAYGTCQDGRLFVARWASEGNEKETFRVEYSNPVEAKGTLYHVFTVAHSSRSSSGATGAGQKRKASREGDYTVFQAFLSPNENRLILYRWEVNLASTDYLYERQAQACLVGLNPEGKSGLVIDPRSISTSLADDSKLVVVYAIQTPENGKGREPQRHFCAPIELETGQLIRTPFALANHVRHAGAVTPFLLAVGTLDELLLYDMTHGAIVHRTVVSDLVGDCKNWSLITEARKARLALLSVQNGHAHVCFSKASLDGLSYQRAQQEGNGYSLAVGLRSSLVSPALLENTSSAACQSNLLGLMSSPMDEVDSSGRRLDARVHEALLRLSACIAEIQDHDNLNIQEFDLLNEYESSVISVLSSTCIPSSPEQTKKRKSDTQSISHKSKASMTNGIHHKSDASDSTQETEATSTATKPEELNESIDFPVNGLKVSSNIRGYTPSTLPQRFVDGATSLVLSVLQLPQAENKAVNIRTKLARLDARLILSRLLRTGKVSARQHFDSGIDHGHRQQELDGRDGFFAALRSLKLTKKGSRRVFSPVDLMHDMLTWCPDVSEGQMITMIHFMMTKALAEDIAENFLDHGNLKSGHSYRVLAKRFVRIRSALRKQQAVAKVNEEEVLGLKEREDALSVKLIRAGTTLLVGRLVGYSRCNETLLRNAMQHGLIGRYEPGILSDVLVDLLREEGNKTISQWTKPHRPSAYTELFSKWIFTLCEACRERLDTSVGANDEGSPESALSKIIASVRTNVNSTETMLTLNDKVHQFGSKSDDKQEETLEQATMLVLRPSHDRDSAPVPPYSIERLAF